MLINSPNISGSLRVTGNSVITGSLTVLGGITGGITGSATTASYVEYTNVANKPALVSGSSQVTYSGLTGIPSGIVSGSSQVSFNGIVDKPTLVSGSAQIDFAGISNKPTLVSGSSQITYSGLTGIPSGILSGSAQVAAFGYATTGSNTFIGNQTITGSILGSGSLTIDGCITATGQIVAQTINVQQVTSSIVYSCGSNVFGNSLSNTQQFTGSVGVTGSLTINGTSAVVGSGTTNYLPKFTACNTIGNSTTQTDATGNLMVGSANSGNAGTINVSVGVAGTTAGGLQLWAANNQTHYLQFGDGTAGAGPYAGYVGYAHSTDSLLFGTATDTRAIISSTGIACFSNTVCAPVAIFSGCVGIGTTTTINKLDIRVSDCTAYSGTCTGNVLTIYNTCAVANGFAGIDFIAEPAAGNAARAAISVIATGNGTADLAFGTRNSTMGERMRITSGGNIEIGTTGFSSPSGADRFIGVYGAQDSSLILQDAVQLWELYVNDDFYINRGSTNVLTALRSNGNVGIGTPSPCANLHVVRAGDGGSGTPGVILSTANGANDIVRFQDGTTTVAVVKNDGSIFAGSSTGVTLNSLTNRLSVSSTTYNLFDISRFSDNAFGPNFYLVKSRNGSIGGNTIVVNGDNLGNITWLGANGTGFTDAAAIKAEVDGTPGASNDMPGRLVFSTTADGAGSVTERMRITSTGNVEIRSAGELRVYRSDNARYGTFYTDNNAVHIASSVDPIRISSADRTEFYTSGNERMRITSTGIACFACQVCAPSIITTGTNSSVRGGDSAFFRGSTVTQSGNSITFDAFRFLNPTGGLGGAASSMAGRLYMSFTDTSTGANQVSYEYLIFTTGNGVSPGPYCFVQLYCGPVRGTNPISAIALCNDGSGGAVKVQATTAASGIAGATAYITYVGTAV